MGYLIDAPAHGLSADDAITFSSLEGGEGIVEGQTYYVIAADLTADAFKFSETVGGAAFEYTTDIVAGTAAPAATYEEVVSGAMAPPDPPSTPGTPTLTSYLGTGGVVMGKVALPVAPALASARLTEIAVTSDFVGDDPLNDPDWAKATIYAVPYGLSEFSFRAIGGTYYAARLRYSDVFGQVSAWGTGYIEVMMAGPDGLVTETASHSVTTDRATNVENGPATVIVDNDGLLVKDGAIRIEDAAGTVVLESAGFGPSWRRFIQLGMYNGDFESPPETLNATLNDTTNPLPAWTYLQTGSGITARVSDGFFGKNAVEFVVAAGASGDEASITQLVPVVRSFGETFSIKPYFDWEIAGATDSIQPFLITRYLDSSGGLIFGHGAVESAIDVGLYPSGTVHEFGHTNALFTAVPPPTAAFIRVTIGVRRGTASTSYTDTVTLWNAYVTTGRPRIHLSDAAAQYEPVTLSHQDGHVLLMMPRTDGVLTIGASTNDTYIPGSARILNGLNLGSGALGGVSGTISGGIGPIRRVYTANSTWTKPDGLHHVEVEVVGGGGGGGGVPTTGSGQSAEGAGGGGGGYSKKLILAAALASSVTVTRGASGSAGNTSGGNGGAGGTSSFGSHCSATGGSGGNGGSASSGNVRVSGGAAGSGSSGDINTTGGDGNSGVVIGGIPALSGFGGNSFYGGVARITTTSNGEAGAQYGGGGSGGVNAGAQGTGKSGGAGAAGVVIVTEYYGP